MPGIFGMVTRSPRATLGAEAAEMSRWLKHHPWYQEDRHVDPADGVALGRVGLGVINAAKQPAVSEDGSLLAVMAGEIFDYEDHRRTLSAAGHVFRGESHAELLLRGYQSSGQAFFQTLRTTFAAALWDRKHRRLVLVNDRFGLKSLYYAQLPGRLLFASELKALLVDPELSRQSNPRGIAQFFTFGQLLGEDTLLQAIRILPAGAWLTYDVADERLRLGRYWRLAVPARGRARPEQEVLDGIDHAMKLAVDRRTAGKEHLGLSLSGGLDARTILGVMERGRPMDTVSLGMEGSSDLRSAAEMARLAGQPNHCYVLNTQFLANYEEHMRHLVHLTDGHYVSQCITIPTLPLYRELGIEVLLRGHAGELMHMDKAYNFSLDAKAWAIRDAAGLEDWLFGRLSAYMLEGVGEALFAPPYRGEVGALARASLRESLRESEGMDHPIDRIWELFLSERLRRETSLSMVEFGSVVETRLPYLDTDLIEALLAAPPELRVGDKIQSHILRNHMPSFLGVVNANTGTRLGAGPARRAYHLLRLKVLAKLGFRGFQPYERLGRWLREDLRPFVERTLLGERCLQRDVFDPDAVRGVVDGHLNRGHNHTYLLIALLIFELGQREFFDGDFRRTGPALPAGNGPRRQGVAAGGA
jgi:asparagine synthase (glutamine-hydrolysing)